MPFTAGKRHTLSHPGTRRYAQTMQQCSLAVPGRVRLHTGTRHTRATARTKYSHIKLQLCALKSGRNVQTECIRRRFEHLHEQLPHCFMPPPPATCQPLLLNIFAAGTHIHTCTCRAHIGPIYLYILQVRRKSSSGGLSGPKVLFGSFRVRRSCHGLLIRLSCCVSNRGTEEETGRGGRGMDKRQTERERESVEEKGKRRRCLSYS